MARMSAFGVPLVFGFILVVISPQSHADWDISITPRAAIRTLHVPRVASSPLFQQSSEQPTIYTGGATLTLSSSDWEGSQLLLTGLYGEGEHDWDGIINGGGIAIPTGGKVDDELVDLEALIRRPLDVAGASWSFGFQYLELVADQAIDPGQLSPFPGGRRSLETTSRSYVLKAGIGSAIDISDSGAHRLFANFLVGLGYTDFEVGGSDDSGGLIATDVNVGYQYLINSQFALALRYRGQFGRSFSLKLIENGFTVLHGPELSFTWSF